MIPAKHILTSALAICSLSASAQLPFWKDLCVTTVNGDAQRTELIFYPTEGEAVEQSFEKSPYYLSLNGQWKFRYFDSCKQIPDRIELTSASGAAAWDDITVPGNWELQGYGTAIYVNQKYEFATVNPTPPSLPENTPAGVYFRTFEVPQSWNGREVFLNICGAKSGAYVYINGNEAGYACDSKDLVRYNITPYLRQGTNDLVIKITRWSAGSYLECMDFWRISGIERDVYLSTEKESTGFDFEVISTLDEEFIRKVTGLIKEGLGKGLNVDTLCAAVNMSRTSFYNKIKALTGEPPAELIRNIRMQEAAILLKTKEYTVSEVSDMLGFADPKYFADTFKKYYGVPPRDYMKSVNN